MEGMDPGRLFTAHPNQEKVTSPQVKETPTVSQQASKVEKFVENTFTSSIGGKQGKEEMSEVEYQTYQKMKDSPPVFSSKQPLSSSNTDRNNEIKQGLNNLVNVAVIKTKRNVPSPRTPVDLSDDKQLQGADAKNFLETSAERYEKISNQYEEINAYINSSPPPSKEDLLKIRDLIKDRQGEVNRQLGILEKNPFTAYAWTNNKKFIPAAQHLHDQFEGLEKTFKLLSIQIRKTLKSETGITSREAEKRLYLEFPKILEKTGHVFTLENFKHALLAPDQKDLRQDFLLAGHEMSFVYKEGEGFATSLLNRMTTQFKGASLEDKKMLIDFAIDLVKQEYIPLSMKENSPLENAYTHFLEQIKQNSNSSIQDLAEEFEIATPPAIILNTYAIERERGELQNTLDSLVKGSPNAKEVQKFVKEFVHDFNVFLGNELAAVPIKDFYQTAWDTKQKLNTKLLNKKTLTDNEKDILTNDADYVGKRLFNVGQIFQKVTDFINDQVVLNENLDDKSRIQMLKLFALVGKEFLDTKNYFLAGVFHSSLKGFVIGKYLERKEGEDSKTLKDLRKTILNTTVKLFEQNGKKDLQKMANEHLTKQEPFIPDLTIFFAGLTNTSEGSPALLDNNSVNLEKLNILAKIYTTIEDSLKQLDLKSKSLHFDIQGEIIDKQQPYSDQSAHEKMLDNRVNLIAPKRS